MFTMKITHRLDAADVLVNQAIMHVNLPSANVTVMQLDVWARTNSIGGTFYIPIAHVKKKLW